MENISSLAALPADLPTNWQENDIVAPNGEDAGLSQQHGYNYLMEQVNAAQEAINLLGNAMVNDIYLLKGGTEIPKDADLDTYIAPGNYYCRLSVTAQTLLNCPVSRAFTLKVEFGTGITRATQVLREYDTGIVYWRYDTVDSTTGSSTAPKWSDWKQYAFVGDITLARLGLTATAAELNYVDGVTSPIQEQINTKLNATTKFSDSGGVAPGVWYSNSNGSIAFGIGAVGNNGAGDRIYLGWGEKPYNKSESLFLNDTEFKYKNKDVYHKGNPPALTDLGVTATTQELNYLSGVKSNIQAQIDQLEASAQRPTWLLQGGIEIPEIADLNTYTTPGNYYCRLSVTAQTLLNCPTVYAFTLKVEFGTGITRATQVLREYNTGIVYWRYDTADSSTAPVWSAWKQYAFVEDITLAKLGITATAAELNKLDGVTATTQELNYVDGVTSSIQGQLDLKATRKRVFPTTTSSSAFSYLVAQNADESYYGGIGVLSKNGQGQYYYIGWGTDAWDAATSLAIGADRFTYQGNAIYHKGNPPSLADLGLDQVAVKMVGSYVGDGTFGADHKIVLNFDRMPHVVFITQRTNPDQESKNAMSHTLIRGMGYFWVGSNSNTGCHINWYETSIEIWSTDNAQYQFNDDGETYDYVAI